MAPPTGCFILLLWHRLEVEMPTDTPEDFEGRALEVRGSAKRRLLRSREALSAGGADEALSCGVRTCVSQQVEPPQKKGIKLLRDRLEVRVLPWLSRGQKGVSADSGGVRKRQALKARNKLMKGSSRFFSVLHFYIRNSYWHLRRVVFVAWYGWYRRGGHFGVLHCQFLLLSVRHVKP